VADVDAAEHAIIVHKIERVVPIGRQPTAIANKRVCASDRADTNDLYPDGVSLYLKTYMP
jgi:hypothetical protein